jgi:photosystem II stability/assembly factor-like uncharacterized protein
MRVFTIPRRAALFAGLALCLMLLWAGAALAAAVSPWSPLTSPAGTAWTVHDVYAFGATGLALGGDGHVAVSRDGGATWQVVTPVGYAATAFTAVAFNSSGRGLLASGGLLVVSSDWGKTWKPPVFAGPTPGAAINDVAMLGSSAVAVGDAGMILTSADSGATWQVDASPTASDLTSVAIAGDGTEVAGAQSGEILVWTVAWTVAATAASPVTAVTASGRVVWGDGQPDLFAATGHDVLGSDDVATFASLPGLPDLTGQDWPAVAWTGLPENGLLVAGAQQAGFFGASQSWVSGASGLLDGVTRGVAPGAQSVAYLLGADGRLVRTLSAGREPATVALTKSRVVVGGRTRLTATVNVAAPGTLLLRNRVPGHPWATLLRIAWTVADWGRSLPFDLSPSLTHDYQLAFQYGGTTVRLADAQVVAVPKVTTARSRYALRRGAVFRFSGLVAPRLAGERVELFTDRGGSWRPVSLQRSVALQNGRSWTSRSFGTPKAETYHLRAHLPRTRAHAEAWSRIVTVAIR